MKKTISFRAPQRTAKSLDSLARRLHTTKARIIEQAIAFYDARLREDKQLLILEKSFGAWGRDESPGKTVARIRRAFQRSWERRRNTPR